MPIFMIALGPPQSGLSDDGRTQSRSLLLKLLKISGRSSKFPAAIEWTPENEIATVLGTGSSNLSNR